MKASDFDFHLPEASIALRPAVPRDSSRLLVLHRDGSLEHKVFINLTEYLNDGDLLLLNNTKVFPARLTGKKHSGGKIEILFVCEPEPGTWEILCRERYTGIVSIDEEISGEMFEGRHITFKTTNPPTCTEDSPDIMNTLWNIGTMPLPPYIKRKPDETDKATYQTVYADKVGSIAAPTAGLHFTEELIAKLEEKGIMVRFLTLHVGTGTFKAIRSEDIKDHKMDAEYFEIERSLADTIKKVKERGKRVITVGTTTTRAVEGFFGGTYKGCTGTGPEKYKMLTAPNPGFRTPDNNGSIHGYTGIFIYPGYKFRIADSLITNFHLPRSTPLMLTAAFGGLKNLMNAYENAVSKGYRFFSYGDAMLIL